MLRVTLICVGRAKAGPERELAARYLDRAAAAGRAVGLSFDSRDVADGRAKRSEDRKAEERRAIIAAAGPDTRLVVLDERGDTLDSLGFAGLLGASRDGGIGSLALIVGGADGLDPALRDDSWRAVAFGAMTWPHQLVRIMACEQLYRAVTILGGHPYHRGA